MKCENCKKNEANFHSTYIINGKKEEHNLCIDCAEKLGYLKRGIDDVFDDFNMFDAYIDYGKSLKRLENTFAQIERALFGGFNGNEIEAPKKSYKNLKYNGKADNDKSTNTKAHKPTELEKLKNQLKLAVTEERYEDAAVINKKIKEIEKNNKN